MTQQLESYLSGAAVLLRGAIEEAEIMKKEL
jgi:hypothetical protein